MPPPRPRRKPKSWSMYPALHDSVSQLLEAHNLTFTFCTNDTDSDATETYDTNIMGRFRCVNKACPRAGWASKVIAITIRMYPHQRYNARVYHQSCKDCGWLSHPILDDSYAERIAYRLKKWSGVEMDVPSYREGLNDRPHESDLCEGCKHGHCRWS